MIGNSGFVGKDRHMGIKYVVLKVGGTGTYKPQYNLILYVILFHISLIYSLIRQIDLIHVSLSQ